MRRREGDEDGMEGGREGGRRRMEESGGRETEIVVD